MGEKFAANLVSGTGSLTVPLPTSPGRSAFGPQLLLSYDSGSGNGPFGFGWALAIPAITRKTDKGLPRYRDGEESDVYILSGAEDLVPVLRSNGTRFEDSTTVVGYTIHRYRPRIEGLFSRIERWTDRGTGEISWRSITRDNVTTIYGKDNGSRIFDPADPVPAHPTRVFSWLISESYDDKGNAIVYEYAAEDDANVDQGQANEHNRIRTANRYLKRIKYGNRISRLVQPDLAQAEWLFEVVFDYDDGHLEEIDLDPAGPEAEQHRFVRASNSSGHPWALRPDPFSSYRSSFEVRTYRRCHRVLMFHRFPELGNEPCLVSSTEFDYEDLDYSQPVSIETELVHEASTRFASFIHSVTQCGFARDDTNPMIEANNAKYVSYLKKSLPPLEFQYSRAVIQEVVRELDAQSLENLPAGLDGRSYQWVDLDGEGVSGILTEQADAWFYKPNLGGGRFGPLQQVARKPSLAAIRQGRQQLLDLAGDGQLDLVKLNGPTPGFYERSDEDWENFRPFRSLPNLSWNDPNLRFVDVTGDGRADVLITEDEALTWYPSLAEEGFGPAERVQQALDEEKGSRLVLADGTQSIYLADLSGDGLTDLLRIRNGDVCYWPNLGYGRFGPKVTMDNAPWFDTADQFDPGHIRLADIDGSGTTDIIYLGRDSVRLYFNQSGNRWSETCPLASFPAFDNLASVMAVDLLGNGTACLVWSSALPGGARPPLRYIDLMGGQKPHLLVKMTNYLGAETHVEYASSTKFYLAAKAEGKPWITRLPYPAHVVERVETYDRITRNRFVTRYAYHHGYFDGEEREFRGFGMVEQWDTEEFAALSLSGAFPTGENFDEASHVPPIYTRTWFHTGVYLGRDRVSNFFAGQLDAEDLGEYYREPGLTDAEARALFLPDTVLPGGLTPEEEREACRALKGLMLRQEIYALDGTAKEAHPYTITEQNFTIRVLQRRARCRHAVLFTHPREAITSHYERNPADARIGHRLTLEVDDFGNVLREATIGYGRRQPDRSLLPEDQVNQAQTLITYTEALFTSVIDEADAYRAPLSCETRIYELTGYGPAGPAGHFRPGDFIQPDATDPTRLTHSFDGEITYESQPTSGRQRRMIEQVRTLYRKNDLTGLLPLGAVESLALAGETYRLAFTPGLLSEVFRRNSQPLLANPPTVLGGTGADQGGYVDLDGDGCWWIPAGRVFLSPDPAHTPAQEVTYARTQFFLPHRYQDPFRQTTTVIYDAYELLLQETHDPFGNLIRCDNDYRVLQPGLVTDANRNRAAVAFDALGLVVGTAVMGKPEEHLGDSLEGFQTHLTEAEILAHLANPLADAPALLGRATTRLVHDLSAYRRTKDHADPQPAVVHTLGRETHDVDLEPGERTKIQHSFSFSDGFAREIQRKAQAESGPVPQRDPNGRIVVGADGQPVMTADDTSARWVGSGRTVFNNKGNPVRQYEPFFTDTHRFESDVKIGVSPVLFYDPFERVVATLHPNRTWEKVVFDPWREETWDVNDTALVADPNTDPDVGDFFRRLPGAEYLPTWHALRTDPAHAASLAARYPDPAIRAHETHLAEKTEVYAGTLNVAHFDTLSRTFLTVAHNRFERGGAIVEERYPTQLEFDIEGNQRAVRDAIVQNGDALGRLIMRYDYDMLGNRIRQVSMEAGGRWRLNDVAGKPIRTWDNRGHAFRIAYDALRRPTAAFLQENGSPEKQVQKTVYGEAQGDEQNHRGNVYQQFDPAGVVTNVAYDFKGNLLESRRRLAQDYRHTPDWSGAPALEMEVFTAQTIYDALNRPVTLHAPDKSVIRSAFNEANLLERVDVNLRGETVNGQPVWTPFVTDIDYNAKGQREQIVHGNGAVTSYNYDSLTFRLARLQTTRGADRLQDLFYIYDPAGNIASIRDDTQQTIYFNNAVVDPHAEYTYDAIYRLIEATGREHIGQQNQPTPSSSNDGFRVNLPHPNDGQAMRRYTERYEYDGVGNILRLIHQAGAGSWTRDYVYSEPSLLEPAKTSNRLSRTTIGALTESYTHDAHGNLTTMPHLPVMRWDDRDRLQATASQVRNDGGTPETTYYVYDATGQRVRKVTEREAAPEQTPTRMKERIFLGVFEVYLEYGTNGTTVTLERETLHVMDDQQRIALVETRTQGNDPAPERLIRYQLGNHLGSVSLELNDQAQIVTYEEYSPYGSTSYQAVRSQTETPKRYRYTGNERDEETGLYYRVARYYAPWLARWAAADPIVLITHSQNTPPTHERRQPQSQPANRDNTSVTWRPAYKGILNCFEYCFSNPVLLTDKGGLQPRFTGSEAHRDILPELAMRINTQTGGYYEATPNVRTLLPGSSTKPGWGVGEVDLAIFATGGGTHIYDLKPVGTSGESRYTKKQLPNYVVKFITPLAATTGTVLERISRDYPGVLSTPIEVPKGDKIRVYTLTLPRDPKTGNVRPGFIEYSWVDVKPPKAPEHPPIFVFDHAPVTNKEPETISGREPDGVRPPLPVPARPPEQVVPPSAPSRSFWATAAIVAGVAAAAIAVDILFPPAALRHLAGSP